MGRKIGECFEENYQKGKTGILKLKDHDTAAINRKKSY